MSLLISTLLSVAVALGQPLNLVENPGFEEGLAGWARGFGQAPVTDETTFHSGKASAQISVDGDCSALDAPKLMVGYDISPDTTYRVSAWIKNGGVHKGSFGGRVYCYGADGKTADMFSFGVLGPKSAPGDWQLAQVEFGPGGALSLPAGTTTIMLRFSIWSPDRKCKGAIWVDDVQISPQDGSGAGAPPKWLKRGGAGTALVLLDQMPAFGTASDPKAIGRLLTEAGLSVTFVSAQQLSQPGALNPHWVDLLLLPYGGAFPADARDAIVAYARSGGSFINMGGLAFERALRMADGKWIDAGRALSDPREPIMVADLDGQESPAWELTHVGATDAVKAEIVQPGADGSPGAGRITLDLDTYAYAGLTHVAARGDEHDVLCFWASGGPETDQLAVELREEDGSRWKHVVRLTGEWRLYELPAQQFRAYASEGRGGPGDGVNPANIDGVWFGMTVAMAGKGEHRFDVDQVAWRRPVSGAGAQPAPVRSSKADLTAAAFGSDLAPGPGDCATIPIFLPQRRLAGVAALAPTSGNLAAIEGSFTGYAATAPLIAPIPAQKRELQIGQRPIGRLLPLLRAQDADGAELGPAASAFFPTRPGQRGSVWAFFGVDNVDLLAAAPQTVGPIVQRIARLATGAPYLEGVEIEFAQRDEAAVAMAKVTVRGRIQDEAQTALRVGLAVDGGPSRESAVPIRSDGVHVIALEGLAPTQRRYQVQVRLAQGNEVIDHETVSVSATECLLQVVQWLVRNQSPDGTFSGISFEDNRAARGLLGAYEITGDKQYKDAAIRWGEEMMRLQREDGGYRMGYGIGRKGEACYVADGGEIAIAMARLVTYAEGARKQRLIDSLRAYMGYRESFRQPSGAIGVGWCLQDYGQRPIVPLDKPTRILAGETNMYTIGCTLAAAAAFARLTGEPGDLAMALKDTEWLLAHYKNYSGAAAESAYWAHHYIADAALKAKIEEQLREGFRKRIVNPEDRSWLGGGGRAVLDLDAITYWLDRVDPADAQMQAAFGRWLYAICGSNSTSAVRHLLHAESLNGQEKRFVDFLAVALADAVQPMASMVDF